MKLTYYINWKWELKYSNNLQVNYGTINDIYDLKCLSDIIKYTFSFSNIHRCYKPNILSDWQNACLQEYLIVLINTRIEES